MLEGGAYTSVSAISRIAAFLFCAGRRDGTAQQGGSRPAIAVSNFSTQGLTSNWYGSFQPGIALSDLLTDRMVNDGRFNVLDRTHVNSTLGEHQLGGERRSRPTERPMTAGHMIGARYLVTGNIFNSIRPAERRKCRKLDTGRRSPRRPAASPHIA